MGRPPLQLGPRAQVDSGRDRPTPCKPGHHVAHIVGIFEPVRHRGQDPRQFPAHVVLGPIRRLVADAQIDVVHFDFT